MIAACDETTPLIETAPRQNTEVCGYRFDIGVSGLFKDRAMLAFSTALMLLDQYLDGGVLVSLSDDLPSIALTLALSIVVPQLVAWAFLYTNGNTTGVVLARAMVCPALSVVGLTTIGISGVAVPESVKSALVFLPVVSLEPIVRLAEDWGPGKETAESVWPSIAEGLLEAPASVVLTLYPAMLRTSVTHKPMDLLFLASSAVGFVSITRCSTKLHFYGQAPSVVQWAKVAVLSKFPCVVSQVLAFAIFAFVTRPFPESEEELRGHPQCYLVFLCLASELALNFALLRAVSPRMGRSVAAMLASSMVVGGPPGFLRALDIAKASHGLQHFMLMLLMAGVALKVTTSAH